LRFFQSLGLGLGLEGQGLGLGLGLGKKVLLTSLLCGQRTSSVYSTQIRNEPSGSGKVKLIDAFKDNWYQNNN
jgi:hypothetical protein